MLDLIIVAAILVGYFLYKLSKFTKNRLLLAEAIYNNEKDWVDGEGKERINLAVEMYKRASQKTYNPLKKAELARRLSQITAAVGGSSYDDITSLQIAELRACAAEVYLAEAASEKHLQRLAEETAVRRQEECARQ